MNNYSGEQMIQYCSATSPKFNKGNITVRKRQNGVNTGIEVGQPLQQGDTVLEVGKGAEGDPAHHTWRVDATGSIESARPLHLQAGELSIQKHHGSHLDRRESNTPLQLSQRFFCR